MDELDRDACYRALRTRDARFDGRFFTCVRSTGIYCRPICPARTPKLENCVFVPSAAAAQEAGFRPCLRCRPEASPDLAVWRGTSNTVSRALALIAEGALDAGAGVDALAARLGVGERQLRRLFQKHLGASPVAVAQTRRLLFSKRLIHETALPMTQVALASGFGSVRRFNASILRSYGRSPSELRRGRRAAQADASAVTLRLPYSPPYDGRALLGFLAARAIPGVEAIDGERYRRTISLGGEQGSVEVRPAEGGACAWLATIRFPRLTALPNLVERLRRVLDLGADPLAIASHLSTDPRLAPLVAARPGLRVPGSFDGFELAVRAILGQQVTVAAATQLAGKLVAAFGEPFAGADAADPALRFVFPRPERLAGADLSRLGMPRARAAAISALAAAVVEDESLFHPVQRRGAAIERLRRLPGVGEWTAQYIAMRALREPDAFPAADLGLLRAMATAGGRPTPGELLAAAEAWRPWRAYAAMHLWAAGAAPNLTETEKRHGPARRPPRLAARLRVARR